VHPALDNAGRTDEQDSTHVLAAIRAHNRVEIVRETLRHTLNVLAELAPDWLLQHAQPDWAERYGRTWDDDRLPTNQVERDALVTTVGEDGRLLLQAAYARDAPHELRAISAVQTLRRVWLQNYVATETGVRWRNTGDGLPPAMRFISSPYDLDAHYAVKRTSSWVGYKVHLTETCDADLPNLITHVETTLAPVTDWDATPVIHHALAKSALVPTEHLVDLGYVDADLLVASRRDFDVDLIGPAKPDLHWQAARRPASRASVSRSIGSDNKRPARKGSSASVGVHWSTIAVPTSSRSGSRQRTVVRAKATPSVSGRREKGLHGGCSPYAARQPMKRCKLPGGVRRPVNSPSLCAPFWYRRHDLAGRSNLCDPPHPIPRLEENPSGPRGHRRCTQLPAARQLVSGPSPSRHSVLSLRAPPRRRDLSPEWIYQQYRILVQNHFDMARET
jgi:hypothetical protein